ncbi:MAG: glutamine--fructose-6-phosphate transaminase (isomerizing), partial [Deltaproteobacteria bacterium]|nr:glutamine--fructose-6-phosphate transaminase (isomerizing) [Deltaproteobacteria bacterium]
MCGIVGYIGGRDCPEIIFNGLKRLEYRGYDSAGIAVISGEGLDVRRAAGKLSNLHREIEKNPLNGSCGIGHTRWATHGKPSEDNAHPHRSGGVVVVHNGIIENFLELKEMLTGNGFAFSSETDTEVIAHLINYYIMQGKDFFSASALALKDLKGSYAISAVCAEEPDRIVVAKNSSPLIIGIGNGENFCASDIPAILEHTRDVIILDEGEIGVVRQDSVKVFELSNLAEKKKTVTNITWSPVMAEKGGYKHFMLKEISEQPRVFIDTIRGQFSLTRKEVTFSNSEDIAHAFSSSSRIWIVACGTSYHAGLVGKYMIERIAGIPVEVDIASEFIYRNPCIKKGDMLIAVSQSGETIDTLSAIKEAKRAGISVLGICNVVGSSIARESDYVIYTHAGPEISVASTKAFTTQIAVLYILAILIGKKNGSQKESEVTGLLDRMVHIPALMEEFLKQNAYLREIARKYFTAKNFLYLGRNILFPVALEGALKLKELSYIHAEGYAAGEMKHGPIALIDEDFPTMALIPQGSWYEKTYSNLQEIRARSGRIIAVASEGDEQINRIADDVIRVPNGDPL